jgi:3-phosphoshikimate 1-carboxyvinyltransferase
MPGKAVIFEPGPLRGSVSVPGDKSISHRALIAGAAGGAPLRVANLNPGRDVRATRDALVLLGVRIDSDGGDAVVYPSRLTDLGVILDCMNSGSTARMLLGACAGAGIHARFDGDASLRGRPMEPVAAQLRAFGARIDTTCGRLPLELRGTPEIQTRRFLLLSPSAQVKSALLFAGLFADVAVSVENDRGSRDHTERLLRHLGAEIEWSPRSVALSAGAIDGGRVDVVGDFSAAAFFIAAAAMTPASALTVRGLGVNPTRTGLLDALRSMGASIELRDARETSGEPVADLVVEGRALRATSIGPQTALRAIDEVPLIAAAAASAAGITTISGIEDLRSKESDRIAATERLLQAVGVAATYERGTLAIVGGAPRSRGGILDTGGDHRIAMAAASLAAVAGPLAIDGDESLDVSFPGFPAALQGLRSLRG